MKLIILSVVIIFIVQSIKLLICLVHGEKLSKKMLSWVCIWTGEFPSTHSAVIAGMIYIIGKDDGMGLLFGLSVIVGGLFIYSLLEDKKRHELFEEYFINSKDESIRKIVSDKKLLQFNGHTLTDVVAGVILGLLVAVLMGILAP